MAAYLIADIARVIDEDAYGVVTPPLTATILGGITRDSALTVLRDLGLSVLERPVALNEILAAHENGSLHECFGTGTAATVSPVRRIRYRNQDIELPPAGEHAVSTLVRNQLSAIATGRVPDMHGWLDVL